MATRITVFEVREGIHGKLGFKIIDRRCSACNEYVPSRFASVCPNCGADFEDQQHDYVSKEG